MKPFVITTKCFSFCFTQNNIYFPINKPSEMSNDVIKERERNWKHKCRSTSKTIKQIGLIHKIPTLKYVYFYEKWVSSLRLGRFGRKDQKFVRPGMKDLPFFPRTAKTIVGTCIF